MAFVHLHNHTEYSLLDGHTHIYDMVRRAADLDMPAVAVTDHGVMSGVPQLCEMCDKVEAETGKRVKPIYGCEVYFTTDEELRKDVKPKLYHLLLLAKTNEGYHNLVKLVSESHVDNFYYKPRTTFSMLQKYGKGIIGSSACIAGIIPKLLDNRQFDEAVAWANKFASCFDRGTSTSSCRTRVSARMRDSRRPSSTTCSPTWRKPPASRPSPRTISTISRKRTRRPRTTCCASARARP